LADLNKSPQYRISGKSI